MTRLAPTLALLAASALAPLSAAAQSAPSDIRAELRNQFEASAQKLVMLAEAMPAESYDWTPGEGVATVGRVYAHIAHYNYLYPESNLGIPAGEGVEHGTWEEEVGDKARLVPILTESMDHVRTVFEGMSDEELQEPTTLYGRQVAKWSVLLQLVAHMNEHLGQSIAYARSNGVVPPWSR